MTAYLLSYTLTGLPWQTFAIAEPSIAVAQSLAQQAATVLGQGLTLTSPTYAGQSWSYGPGATPVGGWVATYNAVFATLGASTSITPGEAAIGQSLAASLLAAGSAYDVGATPGAKNAAPYALQRNAWCNVLAAPTWSELDRLCRYAYQLYSPTDATSAAAFGGLAATWAPNTTIAQPFFVVPDPANGFAYECTISAGSTGDGAQPAWSTTLGTVVSDATGNSWQCVAAVQAAGTTLPFDPTLNATTTLQLRYDAAVAISSGNAALTAMLNAALNAFVAALGAQPTPDADADALTVTLSANLSAALAAAQQWISASAFT